ncbi:MAG: zf-HC2 domain-containing protein [Thermodesulfobacteriota bacterium]
MLLCKDLVENIIEYIDVQVDFKTRERLENHLDQCPECMTFIGTYRKMLELARKLRQTDFRTNEAQRRLMSNFSNTYVN